jgi:hypothetical protein
MKKHTSKVLFGIVILGLVSFAPRAEAVGGFGNRHMDSAEMNEMHGWNREKMDENWRARRRKQHSENRGMKRAHRNNGMMNNYRENTTHPCWSAE